jgi:hypothetical protein
MLRSARRDDALCPKTETAMDIDPDGVARYHQFAENYRQQCREKRLREAEWQSELAELEKLTPKPRTPESTKAATETATSSAAKSEIVRKTDGINSAGIVYKTTPDARVTESAVVRKDDPAFDPDPTDAQLLASLSADAAAYATANTPNANPYPWWTWVDRNLEYRHNFMRDVLGAVIATERKDMRATVKREGDAIKNELEQRARELTVSLREQVLECGRALREDARAAREQQEQQDAVTRYELGVVRRELATLREEVALERGFQALKAEIAVAKAEIPKVPAIEARIDAELATHKAEQKRLERELAKTKDRVGKLRVDQSVTDFSLKKLEEAQQPVVELKFVTEDGRCFSLKDAHPDAIETWRKFAHELVAANDGVMFSNDPNNVISMPIPRRSSDAA